MRKKEEDERILWKRRRKSRLSAVWTTTFGSKSHQTRTFFLLFLSFPCFFASVIFFSFWLWLDLYFLTATKIIAKVMRRRRSPFKERRDDENDGEQQWCRFKGNRELTVLTAPTPLVRQWLSSDCFTQIRRADGWDGRPASCRCWEPLPFSSGSGFLSECKC